MKIFLCASKRNYDKVAEVKVALEKMGHIVTPPNGYENPGEESRVKNLSEAEYKIWKAEMMRTDKKIISENDAILVLNFDKGEERNYIGGATFLEIYRAFEMNKKIFLYNPAPKNLLEDEIIGMGPTIINGELGMVN